MSRGEFVLLVNPDIVLRPDYLENAAPVFYQNPKIGAVCGLLLLDDENEHDCRVAGTGFCISKTRRVYARDYGVRLKDLKRQAGEVFGVDGSLPLYRREMIEDASIEGEFFDEMFFAYKEDSDLSLRARLLGWKFYFNPYCKAIHKQKFKPGNLSIRKRQSSSVKMHAVKNDIITIIKNEDITNCFRTVIMIVARQLAILGYVIFFERTSLRAYIFIFANFKSILSKRKAVKAKQRIPTREAIKNPSP